MKTIQLNWYERSNAKKRRFRELYGRRPTKEEIKLLRRNEIDLGQIMTDPLELRKFEAPYQILRGRRLPGQ